MVAKEDITSLKVAELRDRLQERGLSTKGKKQILVARLTEALQSEEVDVVCPCVRRCICCIDCRYPENCDAEMFEKEAIS
jgi:hypothetical protein